MFRFLYKTTNLINKKIYIGIHSTEDIEDGYLGSGVYIRRALKKYGKENFKREILQFFDTEEDMRLAELEIVNEEFLQRKDIYNLTLGGTYFAKDRVVVKDSNDNIFQVSLCDPRYISGELSSITKNKVTVKDKDGNKFQVTQDEFKNNNNVVGLTKNTIPIRKDKTIIRVPKELVDEYFKLGYTYCNKNKIAVKDKDGNRFQIDKDDARFKNKEVVGVAKGLVTVVDKNGIYLKVSCDDPRYISGELKGCTYGQTVAKDKNNNTIMVDKNDIRLKTGELVGVNKGFTLVYNKDGECFRVSKDDPRIKTGEFVDSLVKFRPAKDLSGNIIRVSKDDPRWKTGEIVGVNKNRCKIRHKETGKILMVDKNDSLIHSEDYELVNKKFK
jgi:RNase P/RNase MRP subunit p29